MPASRRSPRIFRKPHWFVVTGSGRTARSGKIGGAIGGGIGVGIGGAIGLPAAMEELELELDPLIVIVPFL
jgi:hypothetical protein